ncbi:beta-Ig-H3/fasciclin [Streptomyces sp. GMY02]|uniref:beta-Ig-H3/fasciclin n=1 Tax=Streptomyces sp. GMY02 TaxID=1333528 RepID=UPI001C2B9AE7|nr:beta-Ig-H3/fasciclin [Streptomyces sp. GMY02]QXE38746.1 beta-Ig-H3/fasciclin [Streptomyces sp. GMY02]
MYLIKRLTRTAVLGVVAIGTLGVTAPSADAAPGDTAPGCVGRTVYPTIEGFDVFLQNNCQKTASVKVIVSLGPDSPCYAIKVGTSRVFGYEGITGNYDRTVLC